jgi:hypothetical protein
VTATRIFFASIFLITAARLPAQTAAEIETLLSNPAVTSPQAASLVLRAADLSENPSPAQAFSHAMENKWLPKDAAAEAKAETADTNVAATSVASLQGVSLLLMNAFGLKGGLFYRLFKNPHYAYRELVYKDVIQGKADPQMAVTGEHLLFLVNRILSLRDEGKV